MWFRRYPVGQRNIRTDRHTHTDIHITILRHRSSGRSNNTIAYIQSHRERIAPCDLSLIKNTRFRLPLISDIDISQRRVWQFEMRLNELITDLLLSINGKVWKLVKTWQKVTGWWFSSKLEMWANAQRDISPAEYRWRPLFKAAKFGWRPLLECSAVTLPRRETSWNLKGCPKLANRSDLNR